MHTEKTGLLIYYEKNVFFTFYLVFCKFKNKFPLAKKKRMNEVENVKHSLLLMCRIKTSKLHILWHALRTSFFFVHACHFIQFLDLMHENALYSG